MRRFELPLALLVLAGVALAIALSRPEPPDESLFGAEPALEPVLAPLEPPGGSRALEGRVTTAAGQPAEGVLVVCLPPGADAELPPLFHAYTEADGRFALQGLPDGALRVVLSHPSAPPRSLDVELPVTGGVEWSLAEPLPRLESMPPLVRTELSGVLRAEEGLVDQREDLSGFEIWLVPAPSTPLLAGASERRVTTDGQGAFVFSQLVSATYEARCLPPWARGGTWPILARGSVTTRAEGPNSLDLALGAGAVVGQVLETGGRALPGAVVSVSALDALDPVGQPALWPPVVTDADGNFRVELLPSGRYRVRVRAGAARSQVEVAVEAGRTRSVSLPALDPRSDEGTPRQ